MFAECREEAVEGFGENHAIARGEGLHALHPEGREAEVALIAGKEAQVKGVDAVAGHGGGCAQEDLGLILWMAEDGTASGEVSGDCVAGSDSANEVLGGEDEADELGSTPAGHGAGTASGVGRCQEVQGIGENVVFNREGLSQSLDFRPGLDEVEGALQHVALQLRFQSVSRHSPFFFLLGFGSSSSEGFYADTFG